MKGSIDPRVKRHVEILVEEGVHSISEIQRDICRFVKSLFIDSSKPLPKTTNRRFYPSRQDLSGLMHRFRRTQLRGLLDQEMVQVQVSDFIERNPLDTWHFRPSTSNAEGDDDIAQRLLLVHQTEWQRRLLCRYGQELVFLDATYRTTRYAIPLFFLCVHTNNGYIVVAVIIIEREDSQSLLEALQIIKSDNPDWKPNGFMIDASEIEIAAINSAFAGETIIKV